MTSGGALKSEPNGSAFAGVPLKPNSTTIDVETGFCIIILPTVYRPLLDYFEC
jgi:hypothetical protein